MNTTATTTTSSARSDAPATIKEHSNGDARSNGDCADIASTNEAIEASQHGKRPKKARGKKAPATDKERSMSSEAVSNGEEKVSKNSKRNGKKGGAPRRTTEEVVVLAVAETPSSKQKTKKKAQTKKKEQGKELVTVAIDTSDEEAEDGVRLVQCVAQRVQVIDAEPEVDESTVVEDDAVAQRDRDAKKNSKKAKKKHQKQSQHQIAAEELKSKSELEMNTVSTPGKQKHHKGEDEEHRSKAATKNKRRESIEKSPIADKKASKPQSKSASRDQPDIQERKKTNPKFKRKDHREESKVALNVSTDKPALKTPRAQPSNAQDVQKDLQNNPVQQKHPKKDKKSKNEPKQRTVVDGGDMEGQSKANKAQKKTKASDKDRKRLDGAEETSRPANIPQQREGATRNDRNNRAVVYEEYLPQELTMRKLEEGALFQGKLRVNAQYRNNGWVTVDGVSMDILVEGMSHRNRAMDNDLVAVELFPESAWKQLNADEEGKEIKARPKAIAPASTDTDVLTSLWRPNVDTEKCFVKKESKADDITSNNPLKVATSTINQTVIAKGLRPTGKVVFVLASGNEQGFVGQLEPKTRVSSIDESLPPQDDYAYFNAQDLRLPRRIRIPRLQLPDEFVSRPQLYSQQMLCFCRIKAWSTQHTSPKGEFVKTLGEYTGIESGISAILMQFGLASHALDFSSLILEELDSKYGVSGEQWEISADEIAKRRDFRNYQIFSIDPYNARDLDDALHVRQLDPEGKTFEIGVHIADVTHFMEKGSLLDKEAQERATSVYFVNRVLPMLPRVLCEKLCSLQPRVDRLAFSVVWQMNADGTLVENAKPWFGKSIIRSCCKLDYGSAQMMLEGDITSENVAKWEVDRRPTGENPEITCSTVIDAVRNLWKIGKGRRALRFATGAISLNDVKITFKLDANGNPDQFGTYEQKDSNHLVEEYMLLANYLVAQRLLQFHGPLAFIRHHAPPTDASLDSAVELLRENNIALDGSSAKSLSDSLEKAHTEHGDTMYAIAQALLIKPMKPAEYMVAGNGASPESWQHYALNIPYYTHFTSPIRRYADVVVHRLLQESVVLTEEEAGADEEAISTRLREFSSVASNCNDKKMTAKKSEKACDMLFLSAYVKHKGEVVVRGAVIGVGKQSFTVHLMDLGIEHRVFVKDLVGSTSEWDERSKQLTLLMRVEKGKSKKRNKAANTSVSAINEATAPDGGAEENEMTDTTANVVVRIPLTFAKMLSFRLKVTNKMPMGLVYELAGEAK